MTVGIEPASPPAENAAVPLLEAFWPMDLEADDLAAVRADLGIEPTGRPEAGFEGDNFDFDDEVHAGSDRIFAGDGTGPPGAATISDVIDAAMAHPWPSADLPSLAA